LVPLCEFKTDSRSGSYIFLPHQAKRAVQWLWLSTWVNEEKLFEIYQPQAVRVNKLISTWLITNITNVIVSPADWLSGAFRALPINNRNILFKNPEVVVALEIAFELRRPELVELINRRVPVAERIDIWETLHGLLTIDLDFYKDDVGISTVTTILDKLPANDRLRFLTIFSSPDANNILLAPHYFDIWFTYLSGTNLLTYLKQLDLDYLLEKFKSNADSRQVKFKDKLPLPQRIELLKHLSSKFTSEFFQAELLNFIIYIKFSFVDESIKLLHYLLIVEDTVDLTKLTTDFDYWQTTFKNVPAEKRLRFLIIFGNAQHLFLTPHLNVIADNLTANEFYFYAIARPNKPLLRPYLEYNPSVCISHLISKLPESTRYEILSYTYDGSIAAQSNVLAILKTLPINYKWAFLKMASKFNADIFIHLLAADVAEWKAIESTIPLLERDNNPHIYRDFLATFTKIYMALRAGQSSLFKSNMQHQHNPIDFILDYAAMHPNSRSAKTLSLMKKYSNYRHMNIDLMTEIYVYGFSKSGIFKRSRTPYDGYIYTTNGVKQRLTWGEPIFGMFGYRNSRRGKIDNVMDNESNPSYGFR
jgi:hypothetical protein